MKPIVYLNVVYCQLKLKAFPLSKSINNICSYGLVRVSVCMNTIK